MPREEVTSFEHLSHPMTSVIRACDFRPNVLPSRYPQGRQEHCRRRCFQYVPKLHMRAYHLVVAPCSQTCATNVVTSSEIFADLPYDRKVDNRVSSGVLVSYNRRKILRR